METQFKFFDQLEIDHHIASANNQLNLIQNLVVEKSFQYSHVIQVSPQKGVTTRSQAGVKKLNNEITEHCHMYLTKQNLSRSSQG